jgi:nucleotide-binding universal stress UspA family protein
MKRKILVPTDFSKNSWHAIQYAQELYKSDPCDFYILNVFSATGNIVDSLLNMEPGSELYETKKSKSESGLAQTLDMITLSDKKNPKHAFYGISTFNNIVEAIKICVEEKDIEIIVMGTKGETASKKVVYGSTAINVMEKVRNCPVLVIPEFARQQLPKEIVFPTSYKTHFKIRELKYLIDIAKKCNASIKIVHIATEDRLTEKQLNNKKLLEDYFEDVDHSFHSLSNKDISTAIICFVESRGSDMIAFINKKHAFFGSILTQPLVKEISYDPKVPILVLHDLRN